MISELKVPALTNVHPQGAAFTAWTQPVYATLLLSLELTWSMTVGILGIIVRDEAARRSFKEKIGQVGVTLYVKSFSIASST